MMDFSKKVEGEALKNVKKFFRENKNNSIRVDRWFGTWHVLPTLRNGEVTGFTQTDVEFKKIMFIPYLFWNTVQIILVSLKVMYRVAKK